VSEQTSFVAQRPFAMYRAKSAWPEKCIFTNIGDQGKNNEIKVVGGWELVLVKARIGKD